jgi:hypothetical protein
MSEPFTLRNPKVGSEAKLREKPTMCERATAKEKPNLVQASQRKGEASSDHERAMGKEKTSDSERASLLKKPKISERAMNDCSDFGTVLETDDSFTFGELKLDDGDDGGRRIIRPEDWIGLHKAYHQFRRDHPEAFDQFKKDHPYANDESAPSGQKS